MVFDVSINVMAQTLSIKMSQLEEPMEPGDKELRTRVLIDQIADLKLGIRTLYNIQLKEKK